MFKPYAALALTLFVSACSDITNQSPVAFQGTIAGTVGGQSFTGSVAVASQGRNATEAGIEVVLPTAGTKVGWQINEGTCANPGEIVGGRGAYVDLTAGNDRIARVERTFISGRLTADGRYHAVVVNSTDRTVVLGCGNLERVQFGAADVQGGNVPGLHG
jgi:hypothetical protein